MAIQDLLRTLGQRASTGLERMGATTDPRLSPAAQRLAGIQNLSQALRRTGATLSGDPRRMALQAQEDERLRQRKLRESFLRDYPELGESIRALQAGVPASMLSSGQKNKVTAAIENYQFAQTLPEEDRQEFLAITGALRFDPEVMRQLEEEKRKGKAPGGIDLTPGEKRTDEAFSKTANAWQFGEKQQAESNITNLDNKLARLSTGQENVSGMDIGMTPESLRPFVHPDATGFLDEVNDIVFQSLRATLGAQFTAEEGKRLVAATFNQALPEEFNTPRLQRLSAKIKSIYQSKQDAIDYFNEKGTLQGYQGEASGFDDILDAVLFDEFKNLTKDEVLDRYKKASTTEERQSILRFAEMLKQQGQ